jgi:hypothetical protein
LELLRGNLYFKKEIEYILNNDIIFYRITRENNMKKVIKINQFADELIRRIENAKDIDCCKFEIKNLANIAKEKLGDHDIEVDWTED